MGKYKENISDSSVWLTATPTTAAMTLPFYVTESGHFEAYEGYCVKRAAHSSFLMIYTVNGKGIVKTTNITITMQPGQCIIIDCLNPHEYFCDSEYGWDFLWMHFCGSGARSIFNILYPHQISAVKLINPKEFERNIHRIIDRTQKTDISAYIRNSAGLHLVLNSLLDSSLEQEKIKKEPDHDIQTAIEYIQNNFSMPISIDDIIKDIHISKYHFIRIFGRIMGVTPYSYLMNYRINASKTMLRTTDKSISEIAELCGFPDTSNFISQFKKHTGQRPLQYRRDFS